jgi:outer membrane receptor for ferrienterochelin and colicin
VRAIPNAVGDDNKYWREAVKKITDETLYTSLAANKQFAVGMRTSASIIALMAAGVVNPALAQDDDEEVIEEQVVVVGQRASIQSSQKIKQNAEEVMDAITATDIGSLPDRSIADTLQRVPGITVERASEARDPVRMSAEPSGVFVRGLRWVKTELNGRDIFSADSGQALSFSDVSADLVAGVDVFKNPSSEHIEGGIGGVVNLRTRMPFDQDGTAMET